MAGLVPAIHAIPLRNRKTLNRNVHLRTPVAPAGADARDKRGHDRSPFAAMAPTRSGRALSPLPVPPPLAGEGTPTTGDDGGQGPLPLPRSGAVRAFESRP
ncbi:hypothetical protein MCBRY_003296 [Methylocystis bryophila]